MAAPHATDPGPAPLLFGFRGIRGLQIIVVIAAGAMAIAGTLMLRSYLDSQNVLEMLLAILFAVIFIWLFGMAIRLPTSFVAISPDRMRIRFGGFVDTIMETKDVAGAQPVEWKWWRGIGVRTFFAGDVAFVAAWGPAVELTLRRPIRVWLIPKLLPVKATRVVLSVRNPHKMVERFGPVTNAPVATNSKRKAARSRR